MDPCPQGSRSRGISYFHGGPCPEGTHVDGSVDPWEYGDGTGDLTLHWVYTGVGAHPATHILTLLRVKRMNLQLESHLWVTMKVLYTLYLYIQCLLSVLIPRIQVLNIYIYIMPGFEPLAIQEDILIHHTQ